MTSLSRYHINNKYIQTQRKPLCTLAHSVVHWLKTVVEDLEERARLGECGTQVGESIKLCDKVKHLKRC